VTHGLARGGAHRRLSEQVAHLGLPVREHCPATATPVTASPVVEPLTLLGERVPRPLRPPLRYVDQARIERAWARISDAIEARAPAAVFMNPCRLVQSPPLRLPASIPVVYFCDEPRRVDHEPAVARTRRRSTRLLYAPLHRAERRLDARGARRADVILTNSRYTAGQIERAYGRSARAIPLGVSQRLLEAVPPAPGAHAPYVLSVGALVSSKGHDLAIRAASLAASPVGVVLVAPRPDARAAQALTQLAGSLGVSLEVRIAIDDAALAAAYAGASALLYLGRNEPYGLASIEAQACGCPAIVADEGGLPETVVDWVTGRVVPRAAEAAAAALDAIAAERARYAAEARRHAAGLTWQASAAAVRAVVDELVAGR
jgi:glycosyltransferase involved in cell wall biosynthesis